MTFKSMVKHGLAVLADRTGARGLILRGQRARGPRVHIFGYHRIVPDVAAVARTCIGPLCVSTRSFALHLDHLQRRYEIWSLEEAIDLLEGVRRAPARDVAVITFDDGYRDTLEHAAPLLHARRVPATVFVTCAALDGRPLPHDRLFLLVGRLRQAKARLLGSELPDRLVWPLARADLALEAGDTTGAADAVLEALPAQDLELVSAALAARVGEPDPSELAPILTWHDLEPLTDLGLAIGGHGLTHGHLPLADDETLVEEVAGTRTAIARHTGVPPTTFSYPAGRYDARVLAVVRAAGYRAAVTTEDRRNRPGEDVFRLGRKVLSEQHSVGVDGRRIPELMAAQLDGLFTSLGLAHAVPGDRGPEAPWT